MWLSIKTAPRDGREIFAYGFRRKISDRNRGSPDLRVIRADNRITLGGWTCMDQYSNFNMEFNPLAWMPKGDFEPLDVAITDRLWYICKMSDPTFLQRKVTDPVELPHPELPVLFRKVKLGPTRLERFKTWLRKVCNAIPFIKRLF